MKQKRTGPKRPADPVGFDKGRARIRKDARANDLMFRIDGMLMFSLEWMQECYYGGRWATVWALFRKAIYYSWHERVGGLRIWICDRAGWTKIYEVPETATHYGHRQRHGRKCSGSPNCNNMNCIEESVPRWFRWITRWED